MKEPHPEEHASFSCTLSTVLILDFDTFHILTADIKDTVYFRVKECCCIVMGNSLNLALIQHQGSFDQSLAVTCRTGIGNLCIFQEAVRRSP